MNVKAKLEKNEMKTETDEPTYATAHQIFFNHLSRETNFSCTKTGTAKCNKVSYYISYYHN
jgi:hypothetical protein